MRPAEVCRQLKVINLLCDWDTNLASAVGHLFVDVVVAKNLVHCDTSDMSRLSNLGAALTFPQDTGDIVMDVDDLYRPN